MSIPRRASFLFLACAALVRCDASSPSGTVDATFDFANGPQAWAAGFADYPAGQETFHELDAGYSALPDPLGPAGALVIAGNNHSDDLFMYFSRRVDGLRPGVLYAVTFDVEIATNVPRGCGGVGGSPGESVYLKAGASTSEPVTTLDALGTLRLNADKGNQATGGANAIVLGTIENATPCEAGVLRWERKTFAHQGAPLVVRAGNQGSVWLLVGTDSAFEGLTRLFYTEFAATFRPAN
jgi:hypothetical protein